MTNLYDLKIFDKVLVSFELEVKGLYGLVANIIYQNDELSNLYPINLSLTNEGIIDWLQKRVIPKNRQFVEEILKSLYLSLNDTQGIIDICLGLSLNDCYWVVPHDSNIKFADVNLYENKFDEALSLVAYTGNVSSHRKISTSPELTTNGMLKKAWRCFEDGSIYLFKGGSEGFVNSGNEPFNEFYVSQIAHQMGLNSVHYDLKKWKGILGSKCKLFTSLEYSYVPVGDLLYKSANNVNLVDCFNLYKKLGSSYFEQLKSMLIMDSVIFNEDRHFGNFGLLRSNYTGEICMPAPIFDNGLSLFNYAMRDDFNNIETYAKTRTNPYRIPFDEICKAALGSKQKDELRKLINFKFIRHESYNLPEWRLTSLEQFIQKRVQYLLNINLHHKTILNTNNLTIDYPIPPNKKIQKANNFLTNSSIEKPDKGTHKKGL